MIGFRAKRTLFLGLKSLWLHKLRSALTVLGIILGVCSVIVMLAIGEGASHAALEQIRRLGSQNIIIYSVKPPEERSTSSEQTFVLKYGLTYADAERIKSTIPGVQVLVPARHIRTHIRRIGRRIDGNLVATVPWYPEIANREVLRGRFLMAVDMHRQATVCVLNEPLVRELFPFEDPLGQMVRTGTNCYRVVGILRAQDNGASKESDGGANTDFEVYIPMTTAQGRYGDMMFKRRTGSIEATIIQLSRIIVQAPSLEEVVPVSRAVNQVLRYAHEKQDYHVDVPLDLLKEAEETKRNFNMVLGSIAAISLLVGGIGIMNIMLATVTERTREIGIRRALGARRRDIISQFLSETVLLTATGGLLGVGIGIVVPRLVTLWWDRVTIVTASSCILAFCISMAVGLIFGVYPAYRAANMDPIEALRHE